jgi:ATP-dependent DNA helicase RecQ
MVAYAESAACRRVALLGHFGEAYPAGGCGACDNCAAPREERDCTAQAQKLLSCVYRIRAHGGFPTGLGHVVDVLTGADTEKVRRFGHQGLSTHGIGKGDFTKAEWTAFGRQLLGRGLLAERGGERVVVELTAEGLAFLKDRATLSMPVPAAAGRTGRGRRGAAAEAPAPPHDDDLFERLRALRKRLADERGVPPYVVFHDSTLREMARRLPRTEAAMALVPGVGARKLAQLGALFLGEIERHLEDDA